nr:ABC transporter ATP-binding protein [Schwartzia sp. (in: firmicutes)]
CQELCRAGKTVLMVVHELSLAARFCSRLMLIGNNKVMKDGKPEEVLTEKYLTEAYGVPVRVVENPKTGHVEVYTEPNEKNPERKALLHVIQSGETEEAHDKE